MHYIGFLVWLLFILIAAIYVVSQRWVAFDPELKLNKLSAEQLVNNVKAALKEEVVMNNTLIHFTDNNCHCNTYAQSHIEEINNQAKQYAFNVIDFSVDNLQETLYLPSTPAVMLIGENNQLIYFGPYAQGLDCSQENDMIEISWANYQKGFNPNLIYSEAQGCYCHRV